MAPGTSRADPSVPHLDDFESAGTQGWTGHYNAVGPLVCVDFGFPIGEVCSNPPEYGAERQTESPSNHYLRLRAISNSFTLESWNADSNHTGDFDGLGIRKIAMRLKSSGPGDIVVRVGIQSGSTHWVTNNLFAFHVPASGQWVSHTFYLRELFMAHVDGPDDLSTTLAAVDEIRIFNAATEVYGASSDPALFINNTQLWIDDVELPEPGAIPGCAAGAGMLSLLAAWNRRRAA